MKYMVSFSFQELIERIKTVRSLYKNNNKDRIQLIDILEADVASLETINVLNKQSNENELTEYAFAAGLFCCESIVVTYKWLYPERASLYKILFDVLGFKEKGKPDYYDTLTFLGKFCGYFLNNRKFFRAQFVAKKLDIDLVEAQVIKTIQTIFFRYVSVNADNMLNAIPTKKFINEKLATLPDDYVVKAQAINPERLYHAQLGKAVGEVAKSTDEDETHFLTREERFKIAIVLIIMRSTTKKTWFKSELYNLCCEILNIKTINDINPVTQLACLTAFLTLLNDNEMVGKLEKAMQNQKNPTIAYLDSNLYDNRQEVIQMIKELKTSKKSYFNYTVEVSKALAIFSGIVGSAPGYGAGYVLGKTVAMMSSMVDPKVQISKATEYALTLTIGNAGKYMAYYSADKMVNYALEHAFAKIFEILSGLTFAALGGVSAGAVCGVTFGIITLSKETLNSLVDLCLYLREKIDYSLAKNFDPRIVECLTYLPPSVFSEEKKEKLANITKGMTLFPLSPATQVKTSFNNELELEDWEIVEPEKDLIRPVKSSIY